MRLLCLTLLMALLSCGNKNSNHSSSVVATKSAPVSAEEMAWTEQFIELVNNHRSSLGLTPLLVHEDLHAIARTHSLAMANSEVAFGHTGFSGRCAASRLVLGGGNWCAENVARGQKSPQAAFNSWLGSLGHRANLESSRATYMGFGFALGGNGPYWTQIFLER